MFPIRDTVPSRSTPIATWLLIAANCVVFFFELALPPQALGSLFQWFGVVPARYAHPEWAVSAGLAPQDYLPFLTSMFLHGGWLHLIANMWSLWIFGDNVEDRMGRGRFVAFYLTCGVAAGVVHCVALPDSLVPAVGASGAIAGVLGAYFLLFPHSRVIVLVPVVIIPLFFELPAVVYLAVWAASQALSGLLALGSPQAATGIAWWAHVGGFAAGALLLFPFVRRASAGRRPARDESEVEDLWLPYRTWRASR
jgi:membrane associated rhomboid family serine protease